LHLEEDTTAISEGLQQVSEEGNSDLSEFKSEDNKITDGVWYSHLTVQ
jgi:hypothetical protein